MTEYVTNSGMETKTAFSNFRKSAGISLRATADLFNVEPRTILRWEQALTPVPVKRLFEIEEKTGIPRNLLRPDIFEAKAKRKAGAQ